MGQKLVAIGELNSFWLRALYWGSRVASSRLKAGGVAVLSPEHDTISCLILVKAQEFTRPDMTEKC